MAETREKAEASENPSILHASEEQPKKIKEPKKAKEVLPKQTKRNILIRRDTPMDLTKQYLKINNFRPSLNENFMEATTDAE